LATTAPQQARVILNQDIPLANAMLHSLLAMKVVDPAVLVQQILTLQANAAGPGPGRSPAPLASAHSSFRPPSGNEPQTGVSVVQPTAAPTLDFSNVDEQTMIRGIMSLTADQIAAMTPDEQAAIATIKQRFGGMM